MSGVEGSTMCLPRNPPRPPCAPSRFEKSRPRRRGVQSTTPHALCALLWWNFSVRSESSGCSRALPQPPGLGPLLASSRSAKLRFQKQCSEIFAWHCGMTRKGPREERTGRECLSQPAAADGTEESRHRNAEGVAR